MADKPILNTVPEAEYLSDFVTGERLKFEQTVFGEYRRSLDGPMMPGVEAEGSWLNSKRNPKN